MPKPKKRFFFFLQNSKLYNYSVLFWKTATSFLSCLCLASLLFSIVYNLFLLAIPAPYKWMIGLGVVFINLVYGYIITYFFYTLTIVWPSVKRRVQLFTYINNKTVYIDLEIKAIFESLGLDSFQSNAEFNQQLYDKLVVFALHGQTSRTHVDSFLFPTFYHYLLFKLQRIKVLLQELLVFQDMLTVDTVRYISRLDNAIYHLTRLNYDLMQDVKAMYIYTDLVNLPFYGYMIYRMSHFKTEHLSRLTPSKYDNEERKHDSETIAIYNAKHN